MRYVCVACMIAWIPLLMSPIKSGACLTSETSCHSPEGTHLPRAHAPQKAQAQGDIILFVIDFKYPHSCSRYCDGGEHSLSVHTLVSAGRALSVAMALVVIYRTLLKFQILTQQIVAEPVQILIHHRMILSRLRDGMAHARIDKKFHGYAPFFQSSVQLGRI